jgi:prepilin-type N-terminal cleavage/methylation domain-containing protein
MSSRKFQHHGAIGSAERGFSLVELLIVVAIILVICAIALPNFIRARIAANEGAAATNLRAITTASVVYSSQYNNGYPPTLATLGPPSGGSTVATCNTADLIDEVVAAGSKSGYNYAFNPQGTAIIPAAQGCAAAGYNDYFITATPRIENITGIRSFCASSDGVIHFDPSGATAGSEAACALLNSIQ